MTIYHKHHIIPKYAGGSDNPTNIVLLSIKDHAEAHRLLYETHNNWQDYLAWQGLLKQLDNESLIKIKLSESGKKGAHMSAKPWWTNGIDSIRSNTHPGDGWIKGRIYSKIKTFFEWKCEECSKEETKRDTIPNRKLRFCSHKCSTTNHVKTGKFVAYGKIRKTS